MCRLYGFRSNEPTKVECTLVYAQNALLVQSRSDSRGWSHADGWGIACYEDHEPSIERRGTAAFGDLSFSVTAERIFAETVLAHVRRATVGGADLANTHPFSYGRWTFAHNGTVRAVEVLRPRLLAEIRAHLDREPAGTTDSELAFYWLLARLVAHGVDLARPLASAEPLVEVVGRGVVALDAMCVEAGADRPARLNFLVTDGQIMVGSRWRNSLYYVSRLGIHDCEICGIPHVRHAEGVPYRAAIVASEAISHEIWEEVPDASLVVIDETLAPRIVSL